VPAQAGINVFENPLNGNNSASPGKLPANTLTQRVVTRVEGNN